MFGNNLKGEDMLKNMLLPKLVSLNSLNFDFLECSFSDKLMNCKDKKDGLTREGCGRVSIMQAANGLPNCYTLECNYASGRRINHLSAKLNTLTGQVEPEVPITDAKNRFYTDQIGKDKKKGTSGAPVYTIEVFEDIGRAFCIGLLDFYECNTISRLPLSFYKNLEGVKNDILARNPIIMPKKKDEVGESININKLKPIARHKTAKPITITGAEVPKQTTDTTAVANQSVSTKVMTDPST